MVVVLLAGCSSDPVSPELLGTWWQYTWECSCDRSGGPPFVALELRESTARIAVTVADVVEVSASGDGDDCVSVGGGTDSLGRRVEPFVLCLDHQGHLRGSIQRRVEGQSEEWIGALFVGGPLPPPAGSSGPDVTAPERTPLDVVAFRGHAVGATRVVVERDGVSNVGAILPGGDFCIEATLPASTRSTFQVRGISEDGEFSDATEVEVTHDPAAAPPSDPTCAGDEEACAAEEDCSSSIDDDCNGLSNGCDPACNGCAEDDLAPNHTPYEAHALAPGTYSLQVCPCSEDWFAFEVGAGDAVQVDATFSHADVDIDLRLYPSDSGDFAEPVATSSGTTSSESIDYISDGGGTYLLKVESFRQEQQGIYNLMVR